MMVCEEPQIFCGIRVVTRIIFRPFSDYILERDFFLSGQEVRRRRVMKALQKVSKFLSDYTSIVVIAIAVVTFFLRE